MLLRLLFCVCVLLASPSVSLADSFASNWHKQYDRIWLGGDSWANPMEDWKIKNGHAVCTSRGGDRNVHLLTHQLADGDGDFALNVECGVVEKGKHVGVGFRVGIHDDINDYRGNCIWGSGIEAGIVNGKLVVAKRSQPLPANFPLEHIKLSLAGLVSGDACRLTLTAEQVDSDAPAVSLTADVPAEQMIGNVAIVNNLRLAQKQSTGSQFWFSGFNGQGGKLVGKPEQRFGPILWAMHSVSNSRGSEGYVLKLTALMPPLGEKEPAEVTLVLGEGEAERRIQAEIESDSRIASFRIPNWDASRDVAYRLEYEEQYVDGEIRVDNFAGTIRKQPLGRPVILGGLTCQFHSGFPYAPVANNLIELNPDILFFSGDQLYEQNGGYGIIRRPADRAILNYLRKYFMFGWAFRDAMRDRPTLCIPDDHDVFHGNIWGEAGLGEQSLGSGYVQPVQMVQVVHRTNCSHHPDFYDPTPVGNNISVYYGDMVYGRTSFAILGDRQFKSSPNRVNAGKGRPDHVKDRSFDVSTIDKPGLELLGERQEKFLEHWVRDWRGADMKVLLSETVFANVATHGGYDAYLRADLDSGGWPQTARNRALRIIRQGMALHVNGDQHLATLVQYGIDKPRDGSWSFCTPAISAGYPRWWRPEDAGQTAKDRPPHGLPNTGLFKDGFDHPTYVYAVGNPENRPKGNRYEIAHRKGSGFGIVRIDTKKRTYSCEAYRFDCDVSQGPTKENQMPGWPHTIAQTANAGQLTGQLKRTGKIPIKRIVVEVYDEAGDLLYCYPPAGPPFELPVPGAGKYRVAITGDGMKPIEMEMSADENGDP